VDRKTAGAEVPAAVAREPLTIQIEEGHECALVNAPGLDTAAEIVRPGAEVNEFKINPVLLQPCAFPAPRPKEIILLHELHERRLLSGRRGRFRPEQGIICQQAGANGSDSSGFHGP
jgi:hypothetical protein